MENSKNKSQEENNQPIEYEPAEESETDIEKRQAIANKFYNLSSSMKNSIDTLKSLISKQETIGFQQYAVLTPSQEITLIKETDTLNENLGTSRSILDSYITFERSQPDFDKFLNLFYNFHKFISDHRNTIFYRVNANKSKFYYPFYRIDNGINKLSFLFSRLCGTLNIGGDYIMDNPSSRQQSYSPIGDGNLPWRDSSYYGGSDWRSPFLDRDYGVQHKKKTIRDIGDIDDKI